MSELNKYDIFISYRRTDESGKISGRDQARLISKQLELEGYHPFFDYSEIKDLQFDKVIIPAIENSKIFILVITKDSLKRCVNEDDWVRREIETAIKAGCKIINVAPENTFNGWPDTLPESIHEIKTIHISDIHFGALFEMSIDRIIDERIASVVPRPHIKNKTNDLCSQFNRFAIDIFQLTIKFREAVNSGENVDNEYFIGIQDLVKKVYTISELSKHHNNGLYEKSKSIVDHYNLFIESLRKQFTSDRESKEFILYAQKSSLNFTKFVDTVTKAIDSSNMQL